MGKFEKLVDMDPTEFKEIVDINVMGTFYVSHTIVPQLIEKMQAMSLIFHRQMA